jgi:hypothetical protein
MIKLTLNRCTLGCKVKAYLLDFGDSGYRLYGCGGPYQYVRDLDPRELKPWQRMMIQEVLAKEAASGRLDRAEVERFLDTIYG